MLLRMTFHGVRLLLRLLCLDSSSVGALDGMVTSTVQVNLWVATGMARRVESSSLIHPPCVGVWGQNFSAVVLVFFDRWVSGGEARE